MDKKEENRLEQSTIFSAPMPHNDKPSSHTRKRVLTAAALCLGLVLSIAVLYTVIRFSPKSDNQTEANKSVTAILCDQTQIDHIEYQRVDDTFTLRRTDIAGYNSDGFAWVLDDIEAEKQDKDTANNLATTLCNLKGIKMQEADDTLYGFVNSEAVIRLIMENGSDYTVTVGNLIGDERYVKVSGENAGVYRIDNEQAEKIVLEKLDFASKTAYSIASFTTDVSAYKSSAGALERFDSLSLLSKDYSRELVFIMNEDTATAVYSKYLLSSKENYYTQNADKVFSLFTDTLYVSGAYSYFDDETSVAQFGLLDPDITVKIRVGSEEKWFKFKAIDEEYCAVLSDDRHMITKVKKDNIPSFNLKETDFYYRNLLPFGIDDVTGFVAFGNEVSADIKLADTTSEKITAVSGILNQITLLDPVFGDYKAINNSYDFAVEFTLSSGILQRVYFKRNEDSKCIVETMGVTAQISSTDYTRLIKKIKEIP